jgi:hypothetical protein
LTFAQYIYKLKAPINVSSGASELTLNLHRIAASRMPLAGRQRQFFSLYIE